MTKIKATKAGIESSEKGMSLDIKKGNKMLMKKHLVDLVAAFDKFEANGDA
jgi:hypothetical protein